MSARIMARWRGVARDPVAALGTVSASASRPSVHQHRPQTIATALTCLHSLDALLEHLGQRGRGMDGSNEDAPEDALDGQL
jgi:hypothetical protein